MFVINKNIVVEKKSEELKFEKKKSKVLKVFC